MYEHSRRQRSEMINSIPLVPPSVLPVTNSQRLTSTVLPLLPTIWQLENLEIRKFIWKLVGGWPTPLKNMKVNGKDDIPYMKWKFKKCSKPPTRNTFLSFWGLLCLKWRKNITPLAPYSPPGCPGINSDRLCSTTYGASPTAMWTNSPKIMSKSVENAQIARIHYR